jgi:hypothetical protein
VCCYAVYKAEETALYTFRMLSSCPGPCTGRPDKQHAAVAAGWRSCFSSRAVTQNGLKFVFFTFYACMRVLPRPP